jgi:hypothetical protein
VEERTEVLAEYILLGSNAVQLGGSPLMFGLNLRDRRVNQT